MLELLLMSLPLPDEPGAPEDPLVDCAIAGPPRANIPIAATTACIFMIVSPF
jgi:hypothetical protein